jgi:hypothetical protein
LILNCDQPGSEVTLTSRASPGAMLNDFPATMDSTPQCEHGMVTPSNSAIRGICTSVIARLAVSSGRTGYYRNEC